MAKKRELVEAELLRIATGCFTQSGYHETTLDDIVSLVGISRVTFYTYFESKAALLTAIFTRSLENYRATLEELLARPLSRPEKIRQVMAHQIASITTDQPLFRLLFREEANLPPETVRVVEKIQQEVDLLIENEIRNGIERGEVINENPRLLMHAFTGMCNWLYRWYQPGGEITPDEIVRVFSRLLESGGLTPETQSDSGAIMRSLRHVETHLTDVQQELATVSHQLRLDHGPSGS
ncbi:MAG: TetR/AcrR family transcriptional regulator [Desulfurellaceae bacterium]|nr:TetR/AcrR family transcriptional regulator [Desulfurellaceae bacterium]